MALVAMLGVKVKIERGSMPNYVQDPETGQFFPKIKSPEEFEERATEYFKVCDAERRFYTVPGLCHHLGFASKQSFQDYRKRNAEFAHVIARAKLKIEAQRNEQLVTGGGQQSGRIFDLKCNFDWIETPTRVEVNTPGGQPLQLQVMPPAPKDMIEWQQMYRQLVVMKGGPGEVIDVTPPALEATAAVVSPRSEDRGSAPPQEDQFRLP
jgi:hypothetical protein